VLLAAMLGITDAIWAALGVALVSCSGDATP
jgi:hypothetical protein